MCRRRASFSVRSPRGGAPQILAALAALLEAQGGTVAVDLQGFTLRAQVPIQAAPADDSSGLGGDMQKKDSDAADEGDCDAACKGGESSRGHPDEDGTSASRGRKRQKTSGVSNSKDAGALGQEPGAYALQLTLMQESKSTCVAAASVNNAVSEEVAGHFTLLCKMLENDVAQVLGC